MYKHSSGEANVSSSRWNANDSLIFTNIIKLAQASDVDPANGKHSGAIDSGNTTALLIGSAYRPRGALWDDYGDASLDLAKTEVTYGGTGASPTTSTVEAAGILTAEKTSQGGVGGGTLASSTIVRFLNDFEVSSGARMFNVQCTISASDGDTGSGGGNNETVFITYGGVTLLTSSGDHSASLSLARYYFLINAAGTSIDVYVDGVLSSTVNVSGATDGYFRLESYSYVSDSPRTTSNTIVVYDAYYLDDGIADTTDYVYIDDSITLDADHNCVLARIVDTLTGTTTRVIQASFNNGSAWTTITAETMTNVTATNSDLLLRVAYTYTDDGDDFSFTEIGYMYG